MGEVYRAKDTTLGREVAIKVLPAHLSSDPDRLARFQREAQVLASLNHPNISVIYGVEQAGDGIRALVMELVEGPTLAERIAQGPLPVEEAIVIARQIVEALESAHERGIIHRDLKPANVKVRSDGTVKVLDFGLAKALDPSASSGAVSLSPTITSPVMVTGAHVLLGTAAYMAPEQARGRQVDQRADIWAFGCVLFEMLSGRRAFEDEDVSMTLSKILQREVDFDLLPAMVPPRVRQTIRLCLRKAPRERLPHMGAVRLALDGAFEPEAVAIPGSIAQVPWWRRLVPLAAAMACGLLLAAVAAWALWPSPPGTRVSRFAYDIPVDQNFRSSGRPVVAFSPDGRHFVYNMTRGFVIQSLDAFEPRVIPGTEADSAGAGPFFSPDGKSLAYFAEGMLKRVDVGGGTPLIICSSTAAQSAGATWGRDGTILFAQFNDGILRVPASGGKSAIVIAANPGEQLYGPQLLPDGDSVLFTSTTALGNARWDSAQIVVQSLATGKRTVLVTGGSDARYVATGHLLYALRDTLLAIPFDAKRLEVKGSPVAVIQGLVRAGNAAANTAAANYGVSDDGTLVYLTGGGSTFIGLPTLSRPVWVDRTGREESLPVPQRQYLYPRISPKGTRVALDTRDEAQDIWVFDVRRQTFDRLTTDAQLDAIPVWSPDERRLVWSSQRGGGNLNLYWQPADGTGTVERLTNSINAHRASGFTPDGTQLIFAEANASGGRQDLKVLSPQDRRITALLSTPFDEINGEISPDGQWLAYQSNESGPFEVYLRPFPAVDRARLPVSVGGGQQPAWARSGRELFYLTADAALMAVEIRRQADGSLDVSAPKKLIDGKGYYNSEGSPNRGRTYDVSPDGSRFLRIKLTEPNPKADAPRRIVTVMHWLDELQRLVPTN